MILFESLTQLPTSLRGIYYCILLNSMKKTFYTVNYITHRVIYLNK